MMRDKFDARAIANLVLTEGWERGLAISNLKLQKLIFLCHALLLVERNRDLFRGDFVAWKFGPVHPDVYDAFKHFRERPIDRLAMRVNPVTEEQAEIPPITDLDVRDVVNKVVAFYGSWTAAKLVTLTHAEGGPWDVVVKAAMNNANVGLRISSKMIEQRFKYLWFGAKRELNSEEPYEDQPLVA
ncbi:MULTISPECIES: Panacea domain-containing protein [unclassified Bradyrhizobium]|uniref:Panacea domain-containing protein n=1 Tax=unclassified Bradyrhizobium TaxID=2631580 RepID=UPI0028EFB84B|nr:MULTISPECIES: type II toxin-antitoxin system antitoxin SocA domain-containing protein [unclassified Bradyrhizobium]